MARRATVASRTKHLSLASFLQFIPPHAAALRAKLFRCFQSKLQN
uniref:Uncharacterized protein n=1 Tax=Arundo donax TaxID=35708 RepID=A0A0A9F2T0_ARUDO